MTHKELLYYVVDPDKLAKVTPHGSDNMSSLMRRACPWNVFGRDVISHVISNVDEYCRQTDHCKRCWERAANPDYVVTDGWHIFYDGAAGRSVAELSEIFPRVFNLHDEPPVARISDDDLICLLRGEME